MKTKTERILAATQVVLWFIFIGMCIQTGATVISYCVSFYNPEAAKNLYMGLNFSELRQYDIGQYQALVFFVVALGTMKAYIAYLTIKIFKEINLSQPFSMEVAKLIQKISQAAFIAGLVALIAYGYTESLHNDGLKVNYNWPAGEFLLLAGVVFTIARVFKKGVELQSEHELTI